MVILHMCTVLNEPTILLSVQPLKNNQNQQNINSSSTPNTQSATSNQNTNSEITAISQTTVRIIL